MEIIKDEDLEVICSDSLRASEQYNYFYNALFNCQYLTGCRYIELYELDRWTNIDGYNYTLQPAKKNNVRKLTSDDIGKNFEDIINGELSFMNYCRRAAYSRSFRFLFSIYPIFHGKKNVTTHIFRYNRIKQLFNVHGWDVRKIAEWFGEIDEKNINIYLNAELFYNPDV